MAKRILLLLGMLTVFLAGCQSATAYPTATATETVAAQNTRQAGINQPDLRKGSQDNGQAEACSRAQQEQALQPDQVPDWDSFNMATCYQLQIEILPALPGYQGSGTITFTNPSSETLQSIVLRAYPNAPVIYGGSLQVLEAEVDGQSVQPEVFLSDRSAVRLPLQSELLPGEQIQIDLKFAGRLPESLNEMPQVYGVFYASREPVSLSLANWYPILAELESGTWQAEPVSGLGDAVVSPAAFYEVRVDAPEGWQVVSSGTEIEPGFYTTGPMRDFMLVASPQYQRFEQQQGDLRLRVFSLPGGEARAEEALQVTAEALELFTEMFGPYPYNELDVVAQPLYLALGVEYPGLFTLKDTLLEPADDQPWLLSLVTAHETAHQWWYGLVGNDVLKDPWQDEALATFSSLLYQEAYEPANFRGTLAAYQNNVERAVGAAQDPNFTASLRSFAQQPQLYGPLVYQRGGLFFLALRDEIGSQDFYQALQHYYAVQRYQLADPQDLLQSFESSCDCELDEFYAAWDIND